MQFRTNSNLCRKCEQPLALPPRFETAPLGGLSGAAGRVNGNHHFAADRALDGSGMQPRGKTARELTIGRKLRELREARHLTQQDMAGKAGVPRTYISRIENARLLPGPVMLHRIADALAVAILDLLPQTKNSSSAPDLADENYWASFVSSFSQLRPADMAYVVSHVREMVEDDRTPAMMPAYAARKRAS
ncbi:MAG: helix-turn-helix transcriptional regulator [Acidobacteria bacterium]|nr:helix-turn-helix transcriptional regulator [Acidobacteriota bacterium]